MLLRKQSTKFTSLPLLFVSKRFCSSVAVYAAYIPFYDMRANIFKLDTSSSFRSQKRLLRLCALRYLINDCCVQQLWARGSLLFRGSETQDLYPHNKGTIDMAAALSFACSANGKVQHVSKRKQAQTWMRVAAPIATKCCLAKNSWRAHWSRGPAYRYRHAHSTYQVHKHVFFHEYQHGLSLHLKPLPRPHESPSHQMVNVCTHPIGTPHLQILPNITMGSCSSDVM